MGSHAVADLMDSDLPAQGSLSVQSVFFQMLTTVVDLINVGCILFQSIHTLIFL